jgi:hypothetical protein
MDIAELLADIERTPQGMRHMNGEPLTSNEAEMVMRATRADYEAARKVLAERMLNARMAGMELEVRRDEPALAREREAELERRWAEVVRELPPRSAKPRPAPAPQYSRGAIDEIVGSFRIAMHPEWRMRRRGQ